ncbi:unnamed protein product, partial [Prorocentrum cordatum]
ELAKYIVEEIRDHIDQTEKGGAENAGAVLECPICGRILSRPQRAREHAKSHLEGKFACIHKTLLTDVQISHPVIAAVQRSLYDHDILAGCPRSGYASRARSLIQGWIGFTATPGGRDSLYTATGHKRDCDLRLVLTDTGPQYWLHSDERLRFARKFGGHYYTMAFGNMYARFLLDAGGVHGRAFRSLKTAWARGGCEVGSLANRHTGTMIALMLDIAESKAFEDFVGAQVLKCADVGGLRSISIDATYKVALKVSGQTRAQKHNVFSVIGYHGEVLGLAPGYAERPEAFAGAVERSVPPELRSRVEHVASDVVGRKVCEEMQKIPPNLQCVSLDPLHLAFSVDTHTSKRRMRPTAVGLVMRAVLGKFSVADYARRREPFHWGTGAARASAQEQAFIERIRGGDMGHRRAKSILSDMDPNAPMQSREQFAMLMAAIARVYPERMDAQYDKGTLRAQFIAACAPDRAEFYMNNIRYRARLTPEENSSLGVGTTRNEQIHSCINANFRQLTRVDARTMKAELALWAGCETTLASRALGGRTTSRVRRADMKATVVNSVSLFDAENWPVHVGLDETEYQASAPPVEGDLRPRRRGPSRVQETILQAIRAKVNKSTRKKLFDLSTNKRSI